MICLQCGASNSDRSRYCAKCQAVLPKLLTQSQVPSSLEFNDKIEYLHPTVHYETDAILELHEVVGDALNGEDVFENLEEIVEALAETYQDFERENIRPFLEALMEEASDNPDDPFPHQLSYVLKTGFQLFEKGRAALQQFISSECDDPNKLEHALFELGEGHDYIYFGVELVRQRIEKLDLDSVEEEAF